ncbi:MAG: hypothetical protein F4Y04_00690 [Chloroflexi bacterium]|nr:hypothetical protein [Chloroflexota bacterium]
MSHHFRGAQDFSSPQVRVRGANDFRQYSNQRLRLPNERPPLGPRIKRTIGAILTLAILGGIGVGVYFGVTLLLEEDEPAASAVTQTAEPAQTQSAAQTAAEQPAQESETATAAAPESSSSDTAAQDSQESAAAQTQQAQQPEQSQSADQATEPQEMVAVSSIEPSVAEELVTPAQIGGAEIAVERVTAEPIPAGIPKTLADGAAYDPTEPATVFTSRWPVGTTLRLIRLPGATLLTDEEQAEVVGAEALVVVRGTESSNTDLQLSPAAFDRIAFYGTERIIAVRVEVTAAPP